MYSNRDCCPLHLSCRQTLILGEGINAVFETVEAGLGAPDPQKLAEMNQMAFKIKGETSDSEDGK